MFFYCFEEIKMFIKYIYIIPYLQKNIQFNPWLIDHCITSSEQSIQLLWYHRAKWVQARLEWSPFMSNLRPRRLLSHKKIEISPHNGYVNNTRLFMYSVWNKRHNHTIYGGQNRYLFWQINPSNMNIGIYQPIPPSSPLLTHKLY